MNTTSLPEITQESALLASLDKLELCDAWIYWMGFERIAMETNDLDGVELGEKWLGLIDAEVRRRLDGAA